MNSKYNSEYCKAFGLNLRRLRLERKFGMREFADIVDMEYSHLSKIERGVTNTTISTVYALSQALNVAPSELLAFRFPTPVKRSSI